MTLKRAGLWWRHCEEQSFASLLRKRELRLDLDLVGTRVVVEIVEWWSRDCNTH